MSKPQLTSLPNSTKGQNTFMGNSVKSYPWPEKYREVGIHSVLYSVTDPGDEGAMAPRPCENKS